MTTAQPTGTAASATDYVPRHAAWLHEAPVPNTDAGPTPAELAMSGISIVEPAATATTSDDYVTIKEPRRSWRRKNGPSPTPAS